MKPVLTVLSTILLVGGLGIGAAEALPRLDGVAAVTTATAPAGIETARLVCNYRRCFRVGGYRYYRPYYYRPYGYYRPGIGVGIGGFGVRVF